MDVATCDLKKRLTIMTQAFVIVVLISRYTLDPMIYRNSEILYWVSSSFNLVPFIHCRLAG